MRALRWLLVPIVVVPVVLLLLHGFSRDPAAIPSALIGKPMPSFSLVTLDGRTVTAADLRGIRRIPAGAVSIRKQSRRGCGCARGTRCGLSRGAP